MTNVLFNLTFCLLTLAGVNIRECTSGSEVIGYGAYERISAFKVLRWLTIILLARCCCCHA